MYIISQIEQPTLFINEEIAKRNIHTMAAKAKQAGVRFRPHFKTHQSAEIGEWFRAEGVEAITVSSVEMAEYFADHGWNDILIAFPLNLRQLGRITALANRVRLSLLVENRESIATLAQQEEMKVDLWIKVDAGYHRTGISWQDPHAAIDLINSIKTHAGLWFRGLLTHSGNTYHCHGKEEVCGAFRDGIDHLNLLKDALNSRGIKDIEISVGDTPGCSLCDDLTGVDEIRPGNFIFYDAQQLKIGDCSAEQIAVTVACPVVAVHPERREAVIYGGAIHLSKDSLEVDGETSYGLIAFGDGRGWVSLVEDAIVRSLSQEHGVLQFKGEHLNQLHPGDLVYIIPAHSCLTVQVLRKYLTLSGRIIQTMN